jgi:3-oxoacyl-[acyl-carrier protein] reductase
MTTTSTDRVALVTGASGGIGAAVAERLAHAGTTVAVHYSGGEERAKEVAERITAAGGRALTVGGDVGDPEDVSALFDAVTAAFGGVDVVVHAAGIMPLAPLAETDVETFDRLVHVNLRGTFLVDRAAARHVRAGGAIVNLSTSVTRTLLPTYGAYAMTKGAVEAATMILARELRGRDVTVNTIAPGPTATPLFLEGKSPELVDRIAGMNPMERLGTPEDVAEVAAFLAGPGRWVNGQVVFVNGGMA